MTGHENEPVPEIRILRHTSLVVPNVDDSARFYEEVWGLRYVDDKDGSVYLRGAGCEHHILALQPGDHRGVHHISFALDDAKAVDAAAGYLRAQGVEIVDPPHDSKEPGCGYSLRFLDPDGRVIELSAEAAPLAPAEWKAPVVPKKVSHTVLNTPDIDRATDFYTGVLGFRLSDWSAHQMAFLRCNTDHHSVAFNSGPYASLNHVAYELPTMEDVMRGVGNFRRLGRTAMWGPGRHGPGDNVFAYFQDPAGLVCEYTSDILQIPDESTWVPRVWKRSAESVDRWGTAGLPSEEARAAMLGEPEPGLMRAPER
jgi:catechol 2,3-dioxygenase-like lactoylglutathione lyase family enzyme